MEIKFRAWDKDSKIMWQWHEWRGVFVDKNSSEMPFSNFYNKKNIILMQYTGAKDKNGVEIYEGDIIEFEEFEMIDGGEWIKTGRRMKSKVYYEDGEFCAECGYVDNSLNKICTYGGIDPEVVGNIYENPELINDK